MPYDIGALDPNRTDDIELTKIALYRLSYKGINLSLIYSTVICFNNFSFSSFGSAGNSITLFAIHLCGVAKSFEIFVQYFPLFIHCVPC